MANPQYDTIGESYDAFKTLPLSKFPEADTFLTAIGDVTGLTVLDLACGTGFYTRKIRLLGASKVMGVDVSGEMIRVARDREERTPLGITYEVFDVAALPILGSFDIVTGVHLFNYAPSTEALHQMCLRIAANLSDRGSFVHLGMNPDFSYTKMNSTRYGFTIEQREPVDGGHKIGVVAHTQPPISFEAYQLRRSSIEEALQSAGLQSVEWIPLILSADAYAQYGVDFWKELTGNPTLIGLSASR